MKCITELKDWDFKIPELGFEKKSDASLYMECGKMSGRYSFTEDRQNIQQKLNWMKCHGTGQCCILVVYFIRPGYL